MKDSRQYLSAGTRIRFESGKAVEWHAEKNESLLTKIRRKTNGSGMGYLLL